jgi:spore coat polysaccharide biosynthesis protein SpsF
MSTGIIIQARTGSTRLPRKMILPFYNGTGILGTILTRLKEANLEIPIILATTTNPNDDIIEEIANKHDINVSRGSENNVLSRFIYSAEKNSIQKIIRICADNPFLDLAALKHQIKSFKNSETDYWCYSKSDRTPTIKTHYGFWTEGVTLEALKKVSSLTSQKLFQEHVTNYIYSNPERFNLHFENISQSVEKETNIRLTIDTFQDFETTKEIYSELIAKQIPFEANQVICYIKSKPEWIEIMRNQIIANNK